MTSENQETALTHTSNVVKPASISVTPQFYAFTTPNQVFGFTDKGELVVDRLTDFEDARQTGAVLQPGYKGGPQLAVDLGDLGRVVLPRGFTLVSGATEAGKSSFLRSLEETSNLQRLRVVEPHDGDEDLGRTMSFNNVNAALVHTVRETMTKGKAAKVYAIDSLRAPLFETKGAATSKGVIGQFFTQITRVSNSVAGVGITALASVNPMDEDPAYVASFLKKLSASSVAVILLTSSERAGELTRYKGTIALRPDRQARNFTVEFRTKGQPLQRVSTPSVQLDQTANPEADYSAIRSSINAFNNAA